jgi:hypothetical protein
MSGKSIKEQLNEAIASGALTVKKTVATKSNKDKDKTKTKSKAALPRWAVIARKQLMEVRSSADALAKMTGVDDPEFALRLSALWGAADSIRERCVLASKGNKRRELTICRRNAETILNYVKTVQDGLETRDIEPSHFKEISNQMRGHLRELHNSLGNLGYKVAPQAKARGMLDDDSLNHYRHASIKLERQAQKNIEAPAFTVNLPVLAIFEGAVPVKRLEEAGLPVENMNGYPVFLHQTILCVRTHVLDQLRFDRKRYIETVIRRINERSGANDKFVLATDVGMAHAKHKVYMYWLIPSKVQNEMLKTTNSPLREWGLPF